MKLTSLHRKKSAVLQLLEDVQKGPAYAEEVRFALRPGDGIATAALTQARKAGAVEVLNRVFKSSNSEFYASGRSIHEA